MEILLTRHGQTEWNLLKKVQGKADIELNEKGIQQAEETRDFLKNEKIDLILCSPLKRALQTAEIINQGRNIRMIIDERVSERDFGEFEGKNYAQLNGDPRYQAWIDSGGTLAFPGGESREAFIARCVDGMELVMEQIRRQLAYRVGPECRETEDNCMIQEPLPVAAVVHGGTIMALLSHYCGGDYFSYQVKNAEGYHLRLSLQENKMELKEKV